MEKLPNIADAEEKALAEIQRILKEIRSLTRDVDSLSDGLDRLRQIRGTHYEDMNQIQHECLLLRALRWLRDRGYTSDRLDWYWNPHQTGDSSEPDLLAKREGEVILSAEATTSEIPQGVIDSRMRDTLAKLNGFQGERFYFVRTKEMAQRAQTKVARNSWIIKVVQIP
jgi:hypothetical protein